MKRNRNLGLVLGMLGVLVLTAADAHAAEPARKHRDDHQDFVIVKQIDASSPKLAQFSAQRPVAKLETVTIVSERIQRVSASAGSRVPDGTSSTLFVAERIAR